MHTIVRTPLSPARRVAFPPATKVISRGYRVPDLPPASVVIAEQRRRNHSVDDAYVPQVGHGTHHRQRHPVAALSTVSKTDILRACERSLNYPTTSAPVSASVSKGKNGIERLRALRANHPATRELHTSATDARGHTTGHKQVPISRERSRCPPSSSTNQTSIKPCTSRPKIHSLKAQKQVRIVSGAEIISSHGDQFEFPSQEVTPMSKKEGKRPMYLAISDSNFSGSGHPFRASKELPPTPDLGFNDWGRIQAEKNSEWFDNARFGSTNDRTKAVHCHSSHARIDSADDRTKAIRSRSSLSDIKEIANMLADNKNSSLACTSGPSSKESTGIRGFVRKIRLSLTSDKKTSKKIQPAQVPSPTKVSPTPRPKSPRDSFSSWNIFKIPKNSTQGPYTRKLYYARRGYTI